MHAMTKENLEAAFAGESQAHMKYLIFADQAEKDGFHNVAAYFVPTHTLSRYTPLATSKCSRNYQPPRIILLLVSKGRLLR